jgi:ketosteroid isomerase-like protein
VPTDPPHTGPSGAHPDVAGVLAANRTFYEAFELRDLDAMSDAWEHSDRVTCVHPGWSALTGWAAVSASWFALFGGPQRLQFIVTDERVTVVGDVALVSCSENLLETGEAQTVAATNVFVRSSGRWALVHHHGSPVVRNMRP